MAFEIRRAQRQKAKLRLGLVGPSGAGKTVSALLIAYGITEDWNSIGMIDTEHGSGELYVGVEIGGVQIGDFLYGRLTPPFSPARYIEAIRAMEQAGAKVIIIDSLSHAWAGEGGVLDMQGAEAARTKNSWSAWREVTPQHNALVEAMLQSPAHIIATMRSKTEWVVETDAKGKQVPKKVGLAPVQREGMEYEFAVVLDIDQETHLARASKDRTNLLDGKTFIPSVATGQELRQWLERGIDPIVPAPGVLRTGPLAGRVAEEVWSIGGQRYLVELHNRRSMLTPDEAHDYRTLLDIYQRTQAKREVQAAAGE